MSKIKDIKINKYYYMIPRDAQSKNTTKETNTSKAKA